MRIHTQKHELVRHFTLSREDLDLVEERRGASSWLGFATLLLYMRWLGRMLEAGEKSPSTIIAFVADQIDMPATTFDDYARRDEARHAARISRIPCSGFPGRCNRKRSIRCDKQRYCGRHLVENAFCRLKDFRRIATRYDKLAANFLSAVALETAVAFWL